MGRTIGKSSIEVMRKRFPNKASEIETYADAFDVLAEEIIKGGGGGGDEIRVPFIVTANEGGMSITTTARFEDVKTAIEAKKTVVGEAIVNGQAGFLCPCNVWYPSENITSVLFCFIAKVTSSDKPTFYRIWFTAETVDIETEELT